MNENRTEKLLAQRTEALAQIQKQKENIAIPFNRKFAQPEYLERMHDAVENLNSVLDALFKDELALSGPSHFSKENTWVWGGPTPSWGGSMDKDTALKAKEYFGLENVMYVYGALNREMLELHKDCGKLICHLGTNCRTSGAQVLSDVDEAELLSRLSLEYKNVKGGVVDDMLGNYGPNYSGKTYSAMYEALKKHNPELELYAVVYTNELDLPTARILSDCIDRVILWTWSVSDLVNLDLNIEKCRALFPGKKIMMGVFMFDYGLLCLPTPVSAIAFQLEKSRKYLAEGKIHDIVFLGDREIEKCPAVAEYIREFVKNEFSEHKS